ncbi:MAG: hypothetical protein KGJ59_02605 [Bacteroidota bacterium]|nr:hypothetical protein [Bacteroidota bacterium]
MKKYSEITKENQENGGNRLKGHCRVNIKKLQMKRAKKPVKSLDRKIKISLKSYQSSYSSGNRGGLSHPFLASLP